MRRIKFISSFLWPKGATTFIVCAEPRKIWFICFLFHCGFAFPFFPFFWDCFHSAANKKKCIFLLLTDRVLSLKKKKHHIVDPYNSAHFNVNECILSRWQTPAISLNAQQNQKQQKQRINKQTNRWSEKAKNVFILWKQFFFKWS